MSKHSRFQGHTPRPTKTALVAAAKVQAKMDEAKAPPTPEPEKVVLAVVDAGEVTANDVVVIAEATGAAEPQTALVSPATETAPVAEVLAAAVVGDQKAAAAAIVKEITKPAKSETVLYAVGKKYVPKTDRNTGTWNKITKALAEGPKTMKELAEVVKDHKDFLGYMTRGGHIVPHVAKEMVEAATAN
jgi:hypothetical protein